MRIGGSKLNITVSGTGKFDITNERLVALEEMIGTFLQNQPNQ